MFVRQALNQLSCFRSRKYLWLYLFVYYYYYYNVCECHRNPGHSPCLEFAWRIRPLSNPLASGLFWYSGFVLHFQPGITSKCLSLFCSREGENDQLLCTSPAKRAATPTRRGLPPWWSTQCLWSLHRSPASMT